MNKQELSDKLDAVIHNGNNHGLEIFTVLNESGEMSLKKFIATDELKEQIKKNIDTMIDEKYRQEEVEIESADNIADDRKCLYEIPLTDAYNPFLFIKSYETIVEQYDGDDIRNLSGLLFKINFNDKYIWAYQQFYPMSNAKKAKTF